MDFDLNDEEKEVVQAVEGLLAHHAGPARAIALEAEDAYDSALDRALIDAGFDRIVPEMGLLMGVLLVESVARSAGRVAWANRILLAPESGLATDGGPISILEVGHQGPVRWAAHASRLIIVSEGGVGVRELGENKCGPVASNFGYPMGNIPGDLQRAAAGVEAISAARVRTCWRLGLAAEVVGTMDGALAYTVDYLKLRKQFGRTIGSFQAVQHRLSECAIGIEASRWLVREAADRDAPEEGVAAAAAYALNVAGQVFGETHQLSGAIGFTREHDLHVWTMRLQALRLELGGVAGHRQALVKARWGENGVRC